MTGITNEKVSSVPDIWDSEHFGPQGSIALAGELYKKNQSVSVSMNYACAMYSAIGYCVAKIIHGSFIEKVDGVAYLIFDLLLNFRILILKMVKEKQYKEMDSSQKEPFMAYLLRARFITPFSFFSYRKLAIKLGEDVVSEDVASHSTFLLTIARLSRVWFHKKAKEYREIVAKAISLNEIGKVKQVEDGWIDWKTVNRLARLIGDKEMVAYSAPLADSKDVMIKSGM